jgi:heme-degrading monooxygenase HmoA
MTWVRVAEYRYPSSAEAEESIRRAKDSLEPVFRASPGFVAYEVARGDDGKSISISHWETQEQAEDAERTARAWVEQTNAELGLEVVRTFIGEVGFSS